MRTAVFNVIFSQGNNTIASHYIYSCDFMILCLRQATLASRSKVLLTCSSVRPFIRLLPNCVHDILTRSSAIAERPRDAPYRWKEC